MILIRSALVRSKIILVNGVSSAMPNLRRLVDLTNLFVADLSMLGPELPCERVVTLVLTRPTKKMAALMHDIAVTMPMALPPQEEDGMARVTFPARADEQMRTFRELTFGGQTY